MIFIRDYEYTDWYNFAKYSLKLMEESSPLVYDKTLKQSRGLNKHELIIKHNNELKMRIDRQNHLSKAYVLMDDNKYIGHCQVIPYESDISKCLMLVEIIVDKQYRRRGWGNVLLRQAEYWSYVMGYNIKLFVHSNNREAFQMYKHNDFDIVKKIVVKNMRFRTSDILISPISSKIATEEDHTYVYNIWRHNFDKLAQNIKSNESNEMYQKYLSENKNIIVFEENNHVIGYMCAETIQNNFAITDIKFYEDISEQNMIDILTHIEKTTLDDNLLAISFILEPDTELDEILLNLDYRLIGWHMIKTLIKTKRL